MSSGPQRSSGRPTNRGRHITVRRTPPHAPHPLPLLPPFHILSRHSTLTLPDVHPTEVRPTRTYTDTHVHTRVRAGASAVPGHSSTPVPTVLIRLSRGTFVLRDPRHSSSTLGPCSRTGRDGSPRPERDRWEGWTTRSDSSRARLVPSPRRRSQFRVTLSRWESTPKPPEIPRQVQGHHVPTEVQTGTPRPSPTDVDQTSPE